LLNYTRVWDSDALRQKWGFTTRYLASEEAGETLEAVGHLIMAGSGA
jgi:hypothetical protein